MNIEWKSAMPESTGTLADDYQENYLTSYQKQ